MSQQECIDRAIVMDVGSCLCKAGFAGEDTPISIFPTIIGKPKAQTIKLGLMDGNTIHVGDMANSKRSLLNLECPIKNGFTTDWDGMETIWQHTFHHELRINTEECSILLSEKPLTPKVNREKLTQIMFETFSFPAMFMANQGLLSLYASGRSFGMVFDSGFDCSYSVPIYDGWVIPGAIKRLEFAGQTLTDCMRELLGERGYHFQTATEREIVREVKETLCYVALDFESEMKRAVESPTSIEKVFELPDGNTITVGNERFRCSEVLFQPNLFGIESVGIHERAYNCIMANDVDIRRELYCNVVLSGGNTMFKGISDRMSKELAMLAPPTVTVKVVAATDRKYSVWIGGSIMASLSSFKNMWVTNVDYEESGPSILLRKCYL